MFRRSLVRKAILFIIAGIALYTFLGFFLAPYLLRLGLEDYVGKTLKRRVTLEEIHINPLTLKLKINNLHLYEVDGSPLLGFQEFHLDFELDSLFRWAWNLAEIRIDQPQVHIIVKPDGTLNLADLLPEGSDSDQGESRPPRMLLQRMLLEKGRITFSDRRDPTPFSVKLDPINIELSELSTLRERRGRYTLRARSPEGETLIWRGTVSLSPLQSEGVLALSKIKSSSLWLFFQDRLNLQEPTGTIDLDTAYRFDYSGPSPVLVLEKLNLGLKGIALKPENQTDPILTLTRATMENGRFDLENRELRTGKITFSDGRVVARVDQEGRLDWGELLVTETKGAAQDAAAGSAPAPQPWQIKLEAVALDDIAVVYTDRSRSPPIRIELADTKLRLSGTLEFGPETQVLLEKIGVNITALSFTDANRGERLLEIETVASAGGRLDLRKKEFTLKELALGEGKMAAWLDGQRHLNWAKLLRSRDAGAILRGVEELADSARKEGRPWRSVVESMRLEGFSVALSDRGVAPAASLNVQDLNLTLTNVGNDQSQATDFELNLKVKEGGKFSARGTLNKAPFKTEASVEVNRLALAPLQPYLSRLAPLSVSSGQISGNGDLRLSTEKGSTKSVFNGGFSLTNLLIKERDTGSVFLGFRTLEAPALDLTISPNRMEIREVRISEPIARLVIEEDRSMNVIKLFKRETQGAAGPSARKTGLPSAKPSTDFPVTVGRVRLDKGALDFVDLSLRPRFGARIQELEGVVSGLSSARDSRAILKMEGRVEDYGLATIEGEVYPFSPKAFADITMMFRNLDMIRLTPYTIKFAGHEIDSGKLSLDLTYKIRDSRLQGDNRIIVERLKLGKRVESPDAVDLPLELALALLKDSDGKIRIGLPIEGDLNDPNFSYDHLIRKAMLNLFGKIVKAPFTLIGNLLGVESRNLDFIGFEPGKARLLPPEREKLKVLSEGLKKRPELRLQIRGRYHVEADGEALRSLGVRRELARRMGLGIAIYEDPGPVDFSRTGVQKALESLFVERLSGGALAKFKTEFPKAPDGEQGSAHLYQGLFAYLVEREPQPEGALPKLAWSRAEAVAQELMTAGMIHPGRLAVIDPAATMERSNRLVPTRLELAATFRESSSKTGEPFAPDE